MKIAIMAAVAALTISAPAFAGTFEGPRVGVEVGIAGDDVLSAKKGTYGLNVGYDFDIGSNVVIGPEAGISAPFSPEGTGVREIAVGGRIGVPIADRTLVYASVNYSNIDARRIRGSLDGVRLGLGVERAITDNIFVGVETRYGNYERGVELYQSVGRIGYRW